MASHEIGHVHHEEQAHPDAREYATLASILTIVTGFEVALFFFRGVSHGTLVVMLMALMAVKFVMVVGWYMHLKFDHQYFSWIFTGGLFIALAIVLALGALFGIFVGGEDIIREIPAGGGH